MVTKIPYANRDEWLAIRRKYIGGSDAGAVAGFDSYKSPYSLWAEKTGRLPAFEGNVTTAVGAYLEDFIAQLFMKETGKKVRKSNFTYVNDKYPFACANVDRVVVGEDALLEIKSTNSIPVMRKCRKGEYTERWYCQMVHYLAVTGAKRIYLAVLIECRELKIYVLDRDEEEISALMELEKIFWNNVISDIPPAIDGSEATSDAIDEIYASATVSDELDLTAEQNTVEQYMALKAEEKALKALIDKVGNSIKQQMREHSRGFTQDYNISWANSERKTFDTAKLAAEHKNIDLSAYYKTSSFRTFKVTERK